MIILHMFAALAVNLSKIYKGGMPMGKKKEMDAPDTRGRRFHIVINNPAEKGLTHERIKEILQNFRSLRYACFADEIGSQGTYHTHLYLLMKNSTRHSTLRNAFGNQANIQHAKGSSAENRAYILKEGAKHKDKSSTSVPNTFCEIGVCPENDGQGYRSDLDFLYEQVKSGASNYEILESSNGKQMRNLLYVEKARQALSQEKTRHTFRTLTITFIWGATATGKTSYVFNTHSYDEVYRVTEYRNPFDNYSGQDILCLDEYKNSFTIRELLTYLEGFPMTQLKARYSNKYANYTKVYILSNTPLSEQYKDEQYNEPEVWHALLRRITNVYEFLPDGKKLHYTITSDYDIIPDTELESGFGGK